MRLLYSLAFLLLSLFAHAEDVSVRMNRVRHPVTKKWGYAFKEQNINSPLHGVIATGVNWVGFGSQLISKKESELIDWVIPPHYDEVASKFLEGLSMVRIGDKVGFINIYDCFVIAPEYDFTGDLDGFHDGLAAVCKNGKWGYINRNGVYMINAEYDDADAFNDHHLAAVKKNGLWGVIDLNGKVVVPIDNKMKQAMMNVPVSNKAYRAAVATVKKDYEGGAYASRVSQIANTKRTVKQSAPAPAKQQAKGKGKKGTKSTAKQPAAPAQSKPVGLSVDATRESLVYKQVGSGDSLGIKDQYGRWIVPPLFSSIKHDKDDNMFIVKRGDLYGCYLWNGNRLIGTYFDSMSEFSGGKAQISSYGIKGWIDKDGYISPSFPTDLCKAGINKEKSNIADARAMYERCTEICPDYASAYNNIALLDFRNKDYNKGISKLKLAVKLDPNNETISKNLKQAKEERKMRRKARWDTGLDIAMAVITIGTTAYSTYSSISNGGSSGGTGYTASSSGSFSSDDSFSSGGGGGGGGGPRTCVYCKGSGTCTFCKGSGQGPKTISGTNVHETCHYCHGKRTCKNCKGKGTVGSGSSGGGGSKSSGGGSGATCADCHGDGKCGECNGKGQRQVTGTWTTCWRCNGDGKCKSCGATGKR